MKFSILNFQFSNKGRGFTLIEVLVGTFLMLVIFMGIVGAYRVGIRLIGLSKNKIVATAIATGEIEKIRNLSYGTIGIGESSTTTIRNNVEFTVRKRVDYAIDSLDGIESPADDCVNDYKKAGIKVIWPGFFGGEVSLSTDIVPKNLAEECEAGGGILYISVFDAVGAMIPAPLIEIKNPATDELITSATPDTGEHYFSLSTSTDCSVCKVVVSKLGYSAEKTYGAGEVYNSQTIATPEKPHPIVFESKMTPKSFSIDKVSSFSVDTLSVWGAGSFYDSFSDESKISATSSIVVIAGEVNLASTTETGYVGSGYVVSQTITPSNLDKWQEFSWSDFEEPATTTVKYRVLYWSGLDWVFIPDAVLAGNETGFENSPVNLMNLATTTYSELRLKAGLSTLDASTTPAVYSWQVSWLTSNATAIGSATFNLQGAKIIGYNASEQPVYKYSVNHITNSSGHKDISDLEWDLYTFSVAPASGLDLIGIDPPPQPVNLSPDTTLSVKLYLDAQNSLLVTVQNLETLEPVFSASVRLYKTGYDKTQYTDEKGQTYFIPLDQATYNLEISSPSYQAEIKDIFVSGDKNVIISLIRIE